MSDARSRFERVSSFLILALILILPFLPSLREMLPIVSFHGQTLMGFMKEILVVIFFVACFFYAVLALRLDLRLSPLTLLLLFYIAWGAFHIPNVLNNTSLGINSFRLQFIYAIIALSALLIVSSERTKAIRLINIDTILHILIAQSVVISLIAVYELFNPDIKFLLYGDKYLVMQETILSIPGAENVRSVSTLGNPINLGLFLMTAIVALLYWYEKKRTTLNTLIFAAVLLLNITAIGLTLSRTAYLILSLILVCYLLYRLSKGDIIFLFVAVFIGVALFVFLSVVKKDFLENLLLMTERLYNLIDMAVVRDDPRVYNWINFLNFVSSRAISLFWGAGLGISNPSGKEGTFTVENSYLSLFGELGAVGLLIFLLLFFRFIRNAFLLLRHHEHEKQALALVLFSILFFIASLTTDAHTNNPFSAYFWIFLTYSETTLHLIKRKKEAGT